MMRLGIQSVAQRVALIGVLSAITAWGSPLSLSSLSLVGTSQALAPSLLRLTPNYDTNPSGPSPAGAAWTQTTFDVADPFAISFTFRMSDATGTLDNDGSGGDGIAFLIQNDPAGSSALGIGAGGMGFMGIANSVAVMFDTYQNNYAYGDPSGNYVAVNTRGVLANVPHHYCTDGQLTTDTTLPPDLPGVPCNSNPLIGSALVNAFLLDNNNQHDVLLVYNPGSLSVTLDGVELFVAPLDLAHTLSLENGTNAYMGFTAGTRFSYQNQDILSLSYVQVPEPGTAIGTLAGLALIAVLYRCREQRREA